MRPTDLPEDTAVDQPQVSPEVFSTPSQPHDPSTGHRSQASPLRNDIDTQDMPVPDIIPDGDDDLMSTMSSNDGIIPEEALYIPAPPEYYNPFWHWIRTNFPKYFSNELYDIMTTILYCKTTDQLESTLNQISPEKLAQRMGRIKYEKWREHLADLQTIINFTGTYFWAKDDGKEPVPFDDWLIYRAEVYSFALRAFPSNPHNEPPPEYTAVSPLVERERSRSNRDNVRRSQRSQRTSPHNNRSTRSYHSYAPNLPVTEGDNLVAHSIHADYSGKIHHPGERVMADSRVYGCAGKADQTMNPLHQPGGVQYPD